MKGKPYIVAVIPARLASTRLPRKVLRTIAGEPMLAWVYSAARACTQLDKIVIATDSDEVAQLAEAHGWEVTMTPVECASGTDRVYHVAQEVVADIYVNIQGDEPLLAPEHIDALLAPLLRVPDAQVATISTPLPPEQAPNPNTVKVVTAGDGKALYFSRAPIPFDRDCTGGIAYQKHIGLYAYRKAALDRFPHLPASRLEAAERLEQLRFLENGIDVYVESIGLDTVGVDTEEELAVVEAILRERTAGRR